MSEVETAKEPSLPQKTAIDPVTNKSGSSGTSVHYPKSRISLTERYIDEPRSLRVAVIGGGLAGILAGILLPVKVPSIDLVIYEKSRDVVSRSDLIRSTTSDNSREARG